MRATMLVTWACVVALQMGSMAYAAADTDVEVYATGSGLNLHVKKHKGPKKTPGSKAHIADPTGLPPKIVVTHLVRCDDGTCQKNPAFMCADPAAEYLVRYMKNAAGNWVLYDQGCMKNEDVLAQITPGAVLIDLERVGLPELTVHTNPADKTLVNLDTIFYTNPQPVTKTLDLLGQSVLVEATPASYLWHFGDGESVTTDSPGAPYPAMDVTHKYPHAKVTLRPSVDTTYTARFRVNGGPWQGVNGTVTIAGPAIALRVVGATPVLSGNR
jgi:hypothetical protein